MNLQFDPSAVTRFLRGIVSDLREKRLWPVAVVLLAAIVAVPFLLTNSSSPTPVAQVPEPTPPPSQATTIRALNVQSTPAQSRLSGPARSPFTQQAVSAATSKTSIATATSVTSTATSATASANSATTGTSSGGTGATSPTSGPTASTSPTSTPPSITPNAKPKPAPTGLSSTQSYVVALAITNPSGGLNTIDPLERLSVLPSDQQPLLVELGVLQGGNRVLFAVQPGTVVGGPGTCTPGPIDCEILSLGQDQTESLSTHSANGVSQVALFAVTGITVDNHGSSAAADQARRTSSAAGRDLLSKSTLDALSLFQYEPSIGAVVDLRNLTVGGS
jgi:hypothetical protein